jgi:ABC-type sugar transport system ATPase subunit
VEHATDPASRWSCVHHQLVGGHILSSIFYLPHYRQVDSFPAPGKVRTSCVKHDINGSDAQTSILQFILSDKRIFCDEEVNKTVQSLGFTNERHAHAMSLLSGGWKIALVLSHVVLFKADILLLDEPTNRPSGTFCNQGA